MSGLTFEQGVGHAAARDAGADDGDVGLLAERRGLDTGDGMVGWELPKRLGWVGMRQAWVGGDQRGDVVTEFVSCVWYLESIPCYYAINHLGIGVHDLQFPLLFPVLWASSTQKVSSGRYVKLT